MPEIKGTMPIPLAGHSMSIYDDTIIIFAGGDGRRIFKELYLLDVSTFTFSQPNVNGAAPAARCAHSGTIWQDKQIIFGGGDGTRRFKDLYIFSIGLFPFFSLFPSLPFPFPFLIFLLSF